MLPDHFVIVTGQPPKRLEKIPVAAVSHGGCHVPQKTSIARAFDRRSRKTLPELLWG
jgi:hypothetical protein